MAPINDKSRLVNAATGLLTPNGLPLYTVQSMFTFMKTVVGAFGTLVVDYQGSLDNVNWFPLASDNTLVAGPTFVVDKPCLFVRAVVSSFAGGTSVTVDMVSKE